MKQCYCIAAIQEYILTVKINIGLEVLPHSSFHVGVEPAGCEVQSF